MAIPDYDFEARSAAKNLGSRLVRVEIEDQATLFGSVRFEVWSLALFDLRERRYWYQVSFEPLGTRSKGFWQKPQQTMPSTSNRLHFSVLERLPGHTDGAGSVAKLGPIGHVRMQPTSVGLGTYLRDELIDWVAHIHPSANVAKGKLSHVDATEENLDRRSKFYEGGQFRMNLETDGSGSFSADRMDALTRRTPARKVVELSQRDIQELFKSVLELEHCKVRIEKLNDSNSLCRATKVVAQRQARWARFALGFAIAALCFALINGTLKCHR